MISPLAEEPADSGGGMLLWGQVTGVDDPFSQTFLPFAGGWFPCQMVWQVHPPHEHGLKPGTVV